MNNYWLLPFAAAALQAATMQPTREILVPHGPSLHTHKQRGRGELTHSRIHTREMRYWSHMGPHSLSHSAGPNDL